jgi:hypothetical protein
MADDPKKNADGQSGGQGSSSKEPKPFESVAAERNTPEWQVAAVAAQEQWPAGREVTAKAFDAALEKLLNAPLGAHKLEEKREVKDSSSKGEAK